MSDWIRPRLTVYRPADPRPRAMLNHWGDEVIGVAVVAFGRCWSLQWKGTPRRSARWHTRPAMDDEAPRPRPCIRNKAGELCLRRLDESPDPERCHELLRSDPSVALDDGTPQGWVCNAGHRWTCVMTRRADA